METPNNKAGEITAKMLDKMEFKRQAKQKFKERFIMGTIEKDKDD